MRKKQLVPMEEDSRALSPRHVTILCGVYVCVCVLCVACCVLCVVCCVLCVLYVNC